MDESKEKNDFPHVSHRGRSVVDYVWVPHEQVCDVTSMNISLMTETNEKFDLDRCSKIPDHSLKSAGSPQQSTADCS